MNEGASSTACASCRLTCGCVHVFDRSCLMCGRVVIRMSSSNLYTRSALREPARAVNNSAARRRAVQVHRAAPEPRGCAQGQASLAIQYTATNPIEHGVHATVALYTRI